MTSPEADPEFEAVLDYIKGSRGFDFTGYKRSSLIRRVGRRMHDLGIHTYGGYLDHLQVHPEEFGLVFDSILINVSSFFRDPPAWDYLAQEIVPRIVKARSGNAEIRVWSAGVASGEEAYSLAMILAEAMGPENFMRRVKIYATDLDDDALAQARQATYSSKAIEEVPEPLRERYFAAVGDRYTFRSDLRRSVIFGRHDLILDAPISHLDLASCRNTLMYFNSDIQAKVLSRMHFALRDDGFLFLGKAEMLFAHPSLFTPVNIKHRVFGKAPQASLGDPTPGVQTTGPKEDEAVGARLGYVALSTSPVAHLVVDGDARLALANARAISLFGLQPSDVGRSLDDLRVSHRPVELMSRIQQAQLDRRQVRVTQVKQVGSEGEPLVFDVEVRPLLDDAGSVMGCDIVFEDLTAHYDLREELQRTGHELETTNEELQSTNEELETMNEELQSANEELRTLNDELNERTDELNGLNRFTGSILGSLRSGVAVVDADLQLHVWNARAEELWGVRGDEVLGHLLPKLDIGLPVAELLEPVRACVEGRSDHQAVAVDAIDRRGRAIRCRVTCTAIVGDQPGRRGVVIVMEEVSE